MPRNFGGVAELRHECRIVHTVESRDDVALKELGRPLGIADRFFQPRFCQHFVQVLAGGSENARQGIFNRDHRFHPHCRRGEFC